MLKIISLQKYTLSLFFMLAFSVAVLGQNSGLQSDLSNSLKKFNVVRLNNRATLQKVDSGGALKISTAEKEFELNLMPNDLRSSRYKAENTSADGKYSVEKGAVTTYKGNVTGETDSKVRMTLDGAKIEGFFIVSGEKYFVEPAKNYSRLASAEDVVVYNAKDLLKSSGFICDSELNEKIELGREFVGVQRSESAQTLKVLELATEADYKFVMQMGGAPQANNEILSILNMVEGVFEGELNLSIRVVFQHTWTTPDSYNSISRDLLLSSFQNYWNVNFPQAQYPRSSAHLFSGNYPGYGNSYIGYICLNPSQAYGFNGWINHLGANALLTAHEIGHTLGGRHVDGNLSCPTSTIMFSSLTTETPMTFCGYSRNEIGSFISTNGSCLKQQSTSANFDFDADGKADIALFRPSNGIWFITNSNNNSFSFAQFGQTGDKIVPADYDGDGKTDIAVYRGGIWYRLLSSNNTINAVYFGAAADVPAPADFDGDGKADVAVFRPSDGIWHRLLSGSGNAYSAFQFGASGDVPLPADYDGDGKADINVFRPSNGIWYRLNSNNTSFFAVQFGLESDKPLVGDFNGDGKADVAVFRPLTGTWFVLSSINNSLSATSFGMVTDIPTPADYDGDGKTDISVFRPSNGVWYRFNSSNNSFAATQFGAASDIPAAAFYIQ